MPKNLKDCINSALRQGTIDITTAERLRKRYDDLVNQLRSPSLATKKLLDESASERDHKIRIAALTEERRAFLEEAIMSHKDRRGQNAPHEAVWMLIEHEGQMRGQDAENLRKSILGDAQGELEKLLFEFRKGAFSGELRRQAPAQTALMDNIVRELFGTSTDDMRAKELAKSWTEVAEALRRRFNKAGGTVGKLENWGLPQIHDADALRNAGGKKGAAAKEHWIQTITPLLDRDKIKHALTGDVLSEKELADSLSYIYDSIVTDGWNMREPTMQEAGRGALYKQHADHRFLHFKNADAWMQYQKQFGEADPYASMMGHISMMSRDIAAMEMFGPNPDAMMSYLKGFITKLAPGEPQTVKALHRIDAMWSHYKGTANAPVSTRGANIVATFRNLISAASLGMASISSIGDLGTSAITRKFVGLPVAKAMSSYIRQMGPEATRHAVRSGLILESAIHAMHQQARYFGSTSSKSWSAFINDRVLTANGMLPHTQAGKHAFGMDFQAAMADISRHGWDQLEQGHPLGGPLRRSMERHGLTAADWELMRQADHYVPDRDGGRVQAPGPEGTGMLRPKEVNAGIRDLLRAQGETDLKAQDRAQKIADLYHSMILRETLYAVPEGTIRSRSMMVGTNQPGTFVGEMVRNVGQFKSFGASFVTLHGGRIAHELGAGNYLRGGVYFGSLLIVLTLLGGVAMQLKEIAKGNDPRRMDPLDKRGRRFWGAAMLQGGGLGIYGDFLFAEVNRVGGGLTGTVAGPMVERLDNLRKLTIGNLIQLSEEDKRTNAGRELANLIRQNAPFGSLPYTYLAWNRIVMDQLQYLLDKDAHSAFRKQRETRRRDYGQESWWRPGSSQPDRGPEMGRMWPE